MSNKPFKTTLASAGIHAAPVVTKGGVSSSCPLFAGQIDRPISFTVTIPESDGHCPVIDAASGTFVVRLTMPNPQHALPAGLKCMVEFPGQAKAEAAF